MRSHVDPDSTEGCQTGSPQEASNSVYGLNSGASHEYQRLKFKISLKGAEGGRSPYELNFIL